jgi:hypothetical protein
LSLLASWIILSLQNVNLNSIHRQDGLPLCPTTFGSLCSSHFQFNFIRFHISYFIFQIPAHC